MSRQCSNSHTMKVLFACLFLGWIPNVLADTFEVTDTPQLRQALTAAQSNGQDDVIVLADGIYSISADGLGPFQFLDDESFSLSLVAENKAQAVLDGERGQVCVRNQVPAGLSGIEQPSEDFRMSLGWAWDPNIWQSKPFLHLFPRLGR